MARRAFALIELATMVVVVAVAAALLLPLGTRSRNADGLHQSVYNVATLTKAALMYHAGEGGRAPMRGARYSNSQLTGWDTWNFGGKNCSIFWQSQNAGIFDESAYSRPLNRYLPIARIRRPSNYISTPTTFQGGTPTPAERASLQIDVFRSPGDVASPHGGSAVSAYNDVGTSYDLNMKWWSHPNFATGTFTQRFNNGATRIGLAMGGAAPDYVWIHDGIGGQVANGSAGTQVQGQFGGVNKSVVGFADGRAGYPGLAPGAFSGAGYTFVP